MSQLEACGLKLEAYRPATICRSLWLEACGFLSCVILPCDILSHPSGAHLVLRHFAAVSLPGP